MNQWFDDSDQEYGIDTHGMKLFSDESFECEIPMDSISKETLAKLIGGVPIFRCKDCKFWEQERRDKEYGDCMYHLSLTHASDFCSFSERRDNGYYMDMGGKKNETD